MAANSLVLVVGQGVPILRMAGRPRPKPVEAAYRRVSAGESPLDVALGIAPAWRPPLPQGDRRFWVQAMIRPCHNTAAHRLMISALSA
jgi:hypothetical protein